MGSLLKRLGFWACLGIALMVLIVNPSPPKQNSKLANFEKIKPGMTKGEVESIMGETEIYFPHFSLGGPKNLGWNVDATLFSDEYCLQATFDREWRLTKTRFCPVEPSHYRGFLQKLD